MLYLLFSDIINIEFELRNLLWNLGNNDINGWREFYKTMRENNVAWRNHYKRGSQSSPLSFYLLKGLGDESFQRFFMKPPSARSSQIAANTDLHYFRCFVAISGYSSCTSFEEILPLYADNNFPWGINITSGLYTNNFLYEFEFKIPLVSLGPNKQETIILYVTCFLTFPKLEIIFQIRKIGK